MQLPQIKPGLNLAECSTKATDPGPYDCIVIPSCIFSSCIIVTCGYVTTSTNNQCSTCRTHLNHICRLTKLNQNQNAQQIRIIGSVFSSNQTCSKRSGSYFCPKYLIHFTAIHPFCYGRIFWGRDNVRELRQEPAENQRQGCTQSRG